MASSTSVSLQELESRHLAQVYAQFPFEAVSAAGVHVRTSDGREILDLYGGHAVACLGYGHPRVVEALREQAERLTFQSNAAALEVRARAADRLAAFAPDGLDRVFFVNSGAEANENALRIAFKLAPEREGVVALEHAFHGRTAAAGAVTWGSKKWYAFPQTPFPVTFVPRNDVAALEAAVTESTAAVIVEPIQGVAGAFDLAPEFLEAARRRCDVTGASLVFDEVQCGAGRSGRGFAAELYEVTPDLLTSAKSLGAGYPVGAVLMGESVASRLAVGDLGTTFGGGPMACALVATVLETIEADDLLENVRRLETRFRSTCAVGPVEAIRGKGFLLGLRCDRPAATVRDELLARDILVGTSADPKVLRLMPPYVLSEEHVGRLADALGEIDDVNRFGDLAELEREQIEALIALAQRLERTPENQALTGKVLALFFLSPSLRTLTSFQSAMSRLGGSSFVVSPDQNIHRLETRRGVVMDGDAVEHIREALPVLCSYADAIGIRSFAPRKDPREGRRRPSISRLSSSSARSRPSTWSPPSTIRARASRTGRRWTSSPFRAKAASSF